VRKLLPLLVLFATANSLLAANPTISSINPTCAMAGGPQFTLTVIGTNYDNTSVVRWGSANLATTFVSSTQLTATVPAANIATAGTVQVTVKNSTGSASNAVTFTIVATPTISSLNPTCATPGGAGFTLTVNGTNFVSGSTVKWNGTALATTVVSSTQLTATVPASLIAAAGTASITVVSCQATSNAQTFTITNTPVITSPLTVCATVGAAVSYTISATNNPTSFSATPLPPGLSVNTSTGVISGTPTTAGTTNVTITASNGATSCNRASATLVITVGNTPAITSPLTACGTVGVAFSYTITATNNPTSFSASPLPAGLTVNTSTGVISGTPTGAGTTNVTISASNGTSPCIYTGSATLVITISARPTISSIDPTCVTPGGPQFTLTVNGTNFVSTSTVNWNGSPLTTSFVSSTQVTATVPAILIANAGTASITVLNPACSGATSTPVTLTIGNTPAITSPLSATGQIGVAFSYTITATNTNNGTTYCASPLPPGLSLGSGQNRNLISGTPTTAGTTNVTIKVFNGAGTCSNPPTCYAQATLVITICLQDPSITSALTATATLGSPFSYQITADNSPISFDATDLPGGLTVCHDSSEGCTPGLISGTPTAIGVFPVTISATSNNTGPCGSSTATDTLILTISLPGGVFIPPFPGQVNLFNWGPTASGTPPPDAHITFPNATTDNYFILYWNAPGSNTNQAIADSANGGLQRNADTSGMRYNPYDPTNPNSRPDLTKNVWRGNPIPPNDNTSGQFADPRASWYITDPWPTADYVGSSYWAGPNPNMVPLNWPDSGHPFSYTGLQPADKGQYPTDIMASPTPSPDPTKGISLLSSLTNGNLASVTELANVWDPAQLSYTVVNPGGALPDIPNTAIRSPRGAGGHTFAIGRPEFSMFDQNGMRAWQLLDVLSGKTSSKNFTNTAGLVNINTASRDVLRSLAAGILQNRDPAIQPGSLQNNLYPPTGTGANIQQADLFADAVINSRPLLSTSALSAIRDSQGQPFFGNPNQYNGSTQAAPTEWNDLGREELFAKIYNLAATRSRNFRVFVTGQSLDKNGNVLSTVTKVYHVFIKPNRDNNPNSPTYGQIQSQQIQIKYEGSM
jgi:putative Ig domain-containing protein/IPT/TIG domain-containing protein